MIKTLIAASAITLALAGTASAQSVVRDTVRGTWDTVTGPFTDDQGVDTTTTGSISDYSGPAQGNAGAGPCADVSSYDGPHEGTGPIVNGHYCGK
jgi:hypothetical protein